MGSRCSINLYRATDEFRCGRTVLHAGLRDFVFPSMFHDEKIKYDMPILHTIRALMNGLARICNILMFTPSAHVFIGRPYLNELWGE